MKLRQLIYFNAVIEQGFNISAAAKILYTSQPGVSRQLQELADELGVELFQRQGKRLIGLTPVGEEIAALAGGVLDRVRGIRQVADAHAIGQGGGLVVVATRHAAAHRLHEAVLRFRQEMPALEVHIHEEDPQQAATMLRRGEAHLGVLAEPTEPADDLIHIPIDQWWLTLVVPSHHPLGALPRVTLEALAAYPLCTYERTAASRRVIDEAFQSRGLTDSVAFTLASSATILQYVAGGAGVGLIGESAFDRARYPSLMPLDVRHLFRPLTTDVVLPRQARFPRFLYRFLQTLVPGLDPTVIDEARRIRRRVGLVLQGAE